MKRIHPLLNASVFVTVCCIYWPEQRGICREADQPLVSIALREIRIKPSLGAETAKASVHLLVSNRSEGAICILPSEWSLKYRIQYDNEEFDFESGRSQTIQSPRPADISELDMKSMVVAPHGRVNLVFAMSVQSPKGRTGRLELEYQCTPGYAGAMYRGTRLHRDVLWTTTDILVTKSPATGEIVIRPGASASARSEDKCAPDCDDE